jgi:hypothetical protein
MPHVWFTALLSVLLLCVYAKPVEAQRGSVGAALTNSVDQTAIVAGEVIDVRAFEKNTGKQGLVKITHVHAGPKSLKGLAFFNATAEAGSNNGSTAMPLLDVGETGLWLLSIEQNSGQWTAFGHYRKRQTPNYDRRVEWADEIGRLSKLNVPARVKAAKELCGHKTPEVAQLGVDILFLAPPADAQEAGIPAFLEGLLKSRDATPSALTRLDYLLFNREGKKWVESDRRKQLLDRFTEPLTEIEVAEVIDHVRGSQHYRGPHGTWLTAEQTSAIFVKLATDPKQPKAVRGAVVARLATYNSRANFAFDALTAVIRRGDADHRLPAAKGLARFAWHAEAQQDELRALLKDEKDEKVAEVLAHALRESIKPDKN